MRRDVKFIFLILVLIVAPAVILSFLAARVLENWQVILRDRMAGDAQRVLAATAEAWGQRMNGLHAVVQSRLLNRLPAPSVPADFASAVSAAAEIRAEFPWIREIHIVRADGEILYPVPLRAAEYQARPEDVPSSFALLAQADQRRLQLSAPAEAIADYARLLEVPDLDPVVRGLVLLRLGDLESFSGQVDQAVKRFIACTDIQQGIGAAGPVREPEEGFLLDLVALGRLVRMYSAMNRPEAAETIAQRLRQRAVEAFDAMPVTQRARVVETVRGAAVPASDPRWEECLRAYALTAEARSSAGPEFRTFFETLGEDEGLQWVRKGGLDYLVCPAGKGRDRAVIAVLQVDARLLAQAVAMAGRNVLEQMGIRLECEGAEGAAGKDREAVLLERRLQAPLDRLVITASPADPQALAHNARLKKRLYGAGGLLLLAGVIAGAWILWRETVLELRLAKEHSEFAAAVSHDLRTPLSSMRMLAESLYLDRVQDPEKRAKFLGTILKESDRLSRLTDRALYFIRYGEGALRYRFSEGDLGAVVQSAVETFATGIGADVAHVPRESDLETRPDPGDSRWRIRLWIEPGLELVRFDAGALEQVVFNLLDNAVKYSGRVHTIEAEVKRARAEPGGRKGWLRTGRHKSWIEVAVRDHGAGMNSEDIRRITRPYTRGKTAAETHARGVGLGLALCRHVVRAHKGRMLIQSRVGEGSTFRVVLPSG